MAAYSSYEHFNVATGVMHGVFGASLSDVVVLQHCQYVMCFYRNKLPVAT